MTNKKFIFLYPEEDVFEHEISTGSISYKDPDEDKKEAYFSERLRNAKNDIERENIHKEARIDLANPFRPHYSEKLNECIDLRYRKNDFSIIYAILDDSSVSDVIKLKESDRTIKVGMDSKTHTTLREDNTYPYPDQDYILDQILPIDKLIVAGFHAWDCVEKLAKRAYERGIDVLVDEDLTQFFIYVIKEPNFRVDSYPNYNPRALGEDNFQDFMRPRIGKPWLLQNY